MKGRFQEAYLEYPDRIVGQTHNTIPNGSRWEIVAEGYRQYVWTYYSDEEPEILSDTHIKLVNIEDGATVHLLNMTVIINEITVDIVQPGGPHLSP